MDAQVEVVSSSPSSSAAVHRKNNNTLAVFSSLENIHTNNNAMSQKLQNILPTKRFSSSQDKFYAIHHTQHTDENDNENSEPISTTTKAKKTNRGRKRMGDKTTLASSSSPSSSSLSSASNLQQQLNKQRKKPRQQLKSRKDQHSIPSLYQTCVGLWPKSSTLDDLAYGRVKAMSDLLKVRLCQAKFKMMARLDQDNELFSFLSEEYVPPRPMARQPVQLVSRKRQNKSTMCIVGNGKNLFARNNKFNKPDQAAAAAALSSSSSTAPAMHAMNEAYDATTLSDTMATSPQRTKNQKERKRKTPKSATPKQKRVTTPKRRSAAADVVPITLSDGSSFYFCEPCNKKYKNRNGLAYHMERCKYTDKSKLPSHQQPSQPQQDQDPQSQPDTTPPVICCQQQQQVEHAIMIQCDTCHSHLHADCVGLSEDALEESFYCPNCKANRYHVSEVSQVGKDLLQCLLEAQASDQDQQQMTLPQEHFDQIQEFFNHQTSSQQQDTQEEDELLSVLTTQGEEQSSQLHVWDDFNASFDKNNNTGEQWSLLDDDEPFSNYDTDIPSSAWNMSDIGMFGQPPSLLFSDNTVNDDTNAPLMSDLSASLPLNDMPSTAPMACGGPTPLADESTTPSGISSNANTPIQTADGLWFQFANFEDDYQCEN
ncbi:hypothetical protein HMPREF1544_09402 [Mucor circinelloides 1006PhL]|uniref:C2H2-type domain-containing protein n=1 Tax=Mucor circinelloides f. circinelloides (strain 1006PhL) TaxID=1220926 RepID=S2JMQ2_MUCC1|nr:hypothetical protein HMPREF1544_09402 [Mucor circinelloides 1006PhL]